jgi:hypothetical protein
VKTKRKVAGQNWDFDGSTITVRIPMTWKRRSGWKVIIAPDGGDAWAPAKPRPDETPIRALVRAHRWKQMLEEEGTARLGNWPRPRASPAASWHGIDQALGDPGWRGVEITGLSLVLTRPKEPVRLRHWQALQVSRCVTLTCACTQNVPVASRRVEGGRAYNRARPVCSWRRLVG